MTNIINQISHCYSATTNYIIQEKNRTLNTINQTINRIGKMNLALGAVCIGYCVFQHNLVIIGGVIGFIRNEDVNQISRRICHLYHYYFYIVDPIVNHYQLCGWKILYPVVHATVAIITILAITMLKPISTLIIPSVLFGAILVANLVTRSDNHSQAKIPTSGDLPLLKEVITSI